MQSLDAADLDFIRMIIAALSKALITAIPDDIYFSSWEAILGQRRNLKDKTLAPRWRESINYRAGSDSKTHREMAPANCPLLILKQSRFDRHKFILQRKLL
jgi:hypothetical protein